MEKPLQKAVCVGGAQQRKMERSSCCPKEDLNRGPWTPAEDELLKLYIQSHGEGHWRYIPRRAGLKRCGKSCRLRWMNYLRPDIKRGNIGSDEEELILRMHSLLGNRWSLIAGRLPGRTDNEIKNYWNSHLSKKLRSEGRDPVTHKPTPPANYNAHKDSPQKELVAYSEKKMKKKGTVCRRIMSPNAGSINSKTLTAYTNGSPTPTKINAENRDLESRNDKNGGDMGPRCGGFPASQCMMGSSASINGGNLGGLGAYEIPIWDGNGTYLDSLIDCLEIGSNSYNNALEGKNKQPPYQPEQEGRLSLEEDPLFFYSFNDLWDAKSMAV